jgi:putative SOS response-associated peptidase YedK
MRTGKRRSAEVMISRGLPGIACSPYVRKYVLSLPRAHVQSLGLFTTAPNELCAELHNRMPAVLKPEAWSLWLGEEPAEQADLRAMLKPFPSEEMTCWPVSSRVGNVRNNDATLIEPIAA